MFSAGSAVSFLFGGLALPTDPHRTVGQSISLHIFLVAAVAGRPQLPDQPFELIQALGGARVLGELRGVRGALIEIREIRPEVGRGVGVGRRIAIGAGLPLVLRRAQIPNTESYGGLVLSRKSGCGGTTTYAKE